MKRFRGLAIAGFAAALLLSSGCASSNNNCGESTSTFPRLSRLFNRNGKNHGCCPDCAMGCTAGCCDGPALGVPDGGFGCCGPGGCAGPGYGGEPALMSQPGVTIQPGQMMPLAPQNGTPQLSPAPRLIPEAQPTPAPAGATATKGRRDY